MADETQADAGTPRPLTLEWMEASRDHWMQKAIDRKERLTVLLAAAWAVVADVQYPGDGWFGMVDMRKVDALRAAVEAAGREGRDDD